MRACSTARARVSILWLFLLFRRFLPPNPDQAVYSKVLVSFRGTRFPSLLGDESGSLTYAEHRVRFELAEHEEFEERPSPSVLCSSLDFRSRAID